ncbi:MAG TPA: sigma-70 family RNA polymerase sigma factor [Anaerolineaceae bacterium]|nr:sigma-70 family RNA polymerase sigma factor [Anaerolineaceae bacterium]
MPNQRITHKETPPELDDRLICAAMNGDADALAAIYDAYMRRLYCYFYSRIENAVEAEDLTAQTFMAVIEALPRYQHRGQFTAWIFQIARNKVMDYYRRDYPAALVDASCPDHFCEEPLEKVIQDQTVEMLRLHIQQFDEADRELLRLRFAAKCSYVEIADLLGRKEDAVRKSVNRLLDQLYARMEASHA